MEVNRILGVIVLYKCNLINSETFLSIDASLKYIDQRLDLIVYDNSPIPYYSNSKFKLNNFNINYYSDISNAGLSQAYNYAADIGIIESKEYMLIMDQDTKFPVNVMANYLNAVEDNKHINLFVPILSVKANKILSPCKVLFKRGFHIKNVQPGKHSLTNLTPVNSGMLINLDSFLKCGGYNNKVKLDFSDFEFINNFKKYDQYFYVINSIAYQNFSNDVSNVSQLLDRFKKYCQGAHYCHRSNIYEDFQYSLITLLRGIHLTVKTGNIHFFLIWYRVIVLRNEI